MKNDIKTKKGIGKFFYYLMPYFGIILFFLGWQALSMKTELMPSPAESFSRLITVWTEDIARVPMIAHVGISMYRVFGALLIAVLIGVPFGVAMGWSKLFRAIFKPIFEVIQPIPPIAWVPLITLWFGTGEFPRMLIIFIGTIMPIVVNSYSGVSMAPPINFDVGKVFGAKKRQMLFDVVLPSSMNAIFAGIRSALSSGWMVLLAAEMLSARSGLGFLIMRGSSVNDLELAIVGMFMIGLFGATFAFAFDYVERWMCPWKTK